MIIYILAIKNIKGRTFIFKNFFMFYCVKTVISEILFDGVFLILLRVLYEKVLTFY